jgi:hypothetical protein
MLHFESLAHKHAVAGTFRSICDATCREVRDNGNRQATDVMLGGILETEMIVCNQDS